MKPGLKTGDWGLGWALGAKEGLSSLGPQEWALGDWRESKEGWRWLPYVSWELWKGMKIQRQPLLLPGTLECLTRTLRGGPDNRTKLRPYRDWPGEKRILCSSGFHLPHSTSI